jgi:hypothetical protein
MSLIGSAVPSGCRSPLRNINKLKFQMNTDGTVAGTTFIGYTGIQCVAIDVNNVFVLDIPTTFNNLENVSTNPLATPTAAVLISECATFLTLLGDSFQEGSVVWFPIITGPVPPLGAQHSRIWFVFQAQGGAPFIPSLTAIFELNVSNGPVQSKVLL